MDLNNLNLNNLNLNSLKKMLPVLGVWRLKDMIKAIRSCKTAADERAVIAKESAFIRTSFKEENVEIRAINIAKLLYIHMLGYPAHFGQIECLKLVASPRFSDKRLGYLGTMMLLDENQEVLTLVTNCLKNDMNNQNMYIVSLALSTLGNISSQEMSRDLSNEVERLMASSNAYIRKKAALCALRMIKKVPGLIENFLPRAKNMISERTNGPLLGGLTLVNEMCALDPHVIEELRGRNEQSVTVLVRNLKSLATPGYSPEHDVNGISDPFVQVKILRLLRYLGKGDARCSEAMNDVLTQVATTTESSKNVGNAILYEAVLTIMEIESDSALRVLGINILGRFLSNKDNNIKYVALTTLTKTAQATMATDSSALQRHRSIIIDCLHDPDISIRRRALDLCFHLMTASTVRILTRELLSFLEVCDGDTKTAVASRICEYAGRFRPSPRWEIDTVIRVLRVAGAWVDQDVINYLVKLVSNNSQELQQYTVKRLYQIVALEGEKALLQEGLLQALFWHVGEYGDFLILPSGVAPSDEESEDSSSQVTPSEAEVVEFTASVLRGPYSTSYVKEYALMALAKLSSRFTNSFAIDNAKSVITKYQTDMAVELQQRAVEFGQIFGFDAETRIALLERMPILESAAAEEARKGSGAVLGGDLSPVRATPEPNLLAETHAGLDILGTGPASIQSAPAPQGDIYSMVFGNDTSPKPAPRPSSVPLDFMADLGLGAQSIPTQSSLQPAASSPAKNIMGDIFGASPPPLNSVPPLMGSMPPLASTSGPFASMAPFVPTSAPSLPTNSPTNTAPQKSADPLADLLGGVLGSSAVPPPSLSALVPRPSSVPVAVPLSVMLPVPTASSEKAYVCYDKRGLKIELVAKKESAVVTQLTAVFHATGLADATNIMLQVAVPKALKLQMFPPESTTATMTKPAMQSMKVENPTKTTIRLRMKLSFAISGEKVDEMVEFSAFEPSLWV